MANNTSEKYRQEYSKRIMDDSTYQDELSVAIMELERENLTFYCQDSIRRSQQFKKNLLYFATELVDACCSHRNIYTK